MPVDPQPPSARDLLWRSAERLIAEQGPAVPLRQVVTAAGQRNSAAVHYHFGSRMGMVVAVLEQRLDDLAVRERELLEAARARPDDDLRSAVVALVLPAVELAEHGVQGRCYLMILAELVEEDPQAIDAEVVQTLERLGGYAVYALLEERLPAMDDDIRAERLALVTAFILRAIADRSRSGERTTPGRAQLATEPFASNLVDMVVAMLAAPVSGAS